MIQERELWEEQEWQNPLRKQRLRPFLEDLIFPEDCGSITNDETLDVLKRFYSKDRYSYDSDVEQLNAYLTDPGAHLFIIVGDVGVGKTWFVRYQLAVEPRPEQEPSGFGIIDMLRAIEGEAIECVYSQLCPILTRYFRTFFGSAEDALRRLASDKYASRRSLKMGNSDDQHRLGAETMVTRWLALDDGVKLGKLLLRALEHLKGPILFIVIDNLDRASEEDQATLLTMAQRMLKNVRIRVIVPLRRSSTLLLDRFQKLHMASFEDMRLSPLRMKSMLALRFNHTKNGLPLTIDPPIVEKGTTLTWVRVFNRVFDGDAGSLLQEISGSNCRVALQLMKRLLRSTNILHLGNIGSSSAAIPAWMLAPGYEPDEAAPLLNLFDNDRMHEPGNALIRYRVLEFLVREEVIDPLNNYFRQYFARLGYSEESVRDVLSRFLMAAMVFSDRGLTPDRLKELPAEDVGRIRFSETGKAHFEKLLQCEWYYIAAKRAMVKRLPECWVEKDPKSGRYYMTHTNFVDYLKDEEHAERNRIRVWESVNGAAFQNTYLRPPHQMARTKLIKKNSEDD